MTRTIRQTLLLVACALLSLSAFACDDGADIVERCADLYVDGALDEQLAGDSSLESRGKLDTRPLGVPYDLVEPPQEVYPGVCDDGIHHPGDQWFDECNECYCDGDFAVWCTARECEDVEGEPTRP